MGILGLSKLIADEAPESVKETELKSYFGRRIAIDASISLYQFLIAIRYTTQQLTNEKGETTSHLSGFFYRTVRMLELGIKPVFVFDGKPPDMKLEILLGRKERAEKATNGLAALKDGDSGIKSQPVKEPEVKSSQKSVPSTSSQYYEKPLDTKLDTVPARREVVSKDEELDAEEIKLSKRTVRMTSTHINQVKRLLKLLGVPIIESPGEAEAQCAQMAKEGLVYGVATEDMDALTFGAPKMIRHLTNSTTDRIKEIDLQTALKGLELTQEQFIDLSILLGCDYCPSIRGIGPKKGLKLLRSHGSIEKILTENYGLPESGDKDDGEVTTAIATNGDSDDEDGDKKVSKKKGKKKGMKEPKDKSKDIPDNWRFKEARQLFVSPEVLSAGKVTETDLKIRPLDEDGLVQFLVHENQFDEDRVKTAIKRVIGSKGKSSQTRIDSFFKKVASAPQISPYVPKPVSASQQSPVKNSPGKKSGNSKRGKTSKRGRKPK